MEIKFVYPIWIPYFGWSMVTHAAGSKIVIINLHLDNDVLFSWLNNILSHQQQRWHHQKKTNRLQKINYKILFDDTLNCKWLGHILVSSCSWGCSCGILTIVELRSGHKVSLLSCLLIKKLYWPLTMCSVSITFGRWTKLHINLHRSL